MLTTLVILLRVSFRGLSFTGPRETLVHIFIDCLMILNILSELNKLVLKMWEFIAREKGGLVQWFIFN